MTRPQPWRKLPTMPRKSASPEATETSPVADFEASLDALEQLVEKMEHGELSLEQSLAAYERGAGLYRRCQQALEQAELRVKLHRGPDNPASAEAFGPRPDARPRGGRFQARPSGHPLAPATRTHARKHPARGRTAA